MFWRFFCLDYSKKQNKTNKTSSDAAVWDLRNTTPVRNEAAGCFLSHSTVSSLPYLTFIFHCCSYALAFGAFHLCFMHLTWIYTHASIVYIWHEWDLIMQRETPKVPAVVSAADKHKRGRTFIHVSALVHAPTWGIHDIFLLCVIVTWIFYLFFIGDLKGDQIVWHISQSVNRKRKSAKSTAGLIYVVTQKKPAASGDICGCAD